MLYMAKVTAPLSSRLKQVLCCRISLFLLASLSCVAQSTRRKPPKRYLLLLIEFYRARFLNR